MKFLRIRAIKACRSRELRNFQSQTIRVFLIKVFGRIRHFEALEKYLLFLPKLNLACIYIVRKV